MKRLRRESLRFEVRPFRGLRSAAPKRFASTVRGAFITLGDGQHWTYPYTFSLSAVGFWKAQFLLFEDGILTKQELHLFVKVPWS